MNAWVVPGYTESRELGAGAGGRVVLAVHEASGTPVAVKYLSERLRRDEAFVRGFRGEARLLAGLESPYVVGLYEYVEAPAGAAIVMELVDGVSLRALLAREGATGPEAALVILKGSLLGLAAAHRAGVVHRDYKPENVLVAADGSSKLVDFGIATDRGSSPGIAGTPAYMAPEQWNGAPASPAADVYAATATFFECLTGRKPFTGGNVAELALQHLDAPVPDASAPEPLRPLIRRGLAKAPGARPENAAVFVRELESVAVAAYGPGWESRGRARLAALAALLAALFPSAGTTAQSVTALATTRLPAAPPSPRGVPRRVPRGLPAGAAALVVALLLALGARAGGQEADDGEAARAFATATTRPGSPTPDPAGSPTAPGPSSPGPGASPTPTGPTPSSAAPSVAPSTPATGTPTPPEAPATPGTGDGTGDGTAASPTAGATTPPPTTGAPPTTPTTPGTAPSTPAPTTTRPTVPPVSVKAVSITALRQTGTATAEVTVEITTDGPGPVTLFLEWFTADTARSAGTPDGTDTVRREGATRYTVTVPHTVRGTGCHWSVRASTDPASAGGGSSQQLLTRRCTIA